MIGRPQPGDVAPYYFRYIDLVATDDVVGLIDRQLGEMASFLGAISEEQSRFRYEPGKWSMKQVLSHVTDAELLFLSRAFWFARGFDSPLPSFDEKQSAEVAGADGIPWADLVDAFRGVRSATIGFFRTLPPEASSRRGTASDNPFTVGALAYIIAGHLRHHEAVLRERYLAGARPRS